MKIDKEGTIEIGPNGEILVKNFHISECGEEGGYNALASLAAERVKLAAEKLKEGEILKP